MNWLKPWEALALGASLAAVLVASYHALNVPPAAPEAPDFSVRYGGRTVHIEVFVNTDEDADAIAQRLRAAASGPRQSMTVAAGGVLKPAAAASFWAARSFPAGFEHRGDQKSDPSAD